MNPRIAALLAATVWIVSLVVAGAVGWRLAQSRSEASRGPERGGKQAAPANAPRADELARLRDENAALRRALRRTEGGPPESSGTGLNDASSAKPADREADASRKVDYYLDRYFAARREDELFSGLEDAASLALYVARAGAPAVEQMAERARNAELIDERILALEVLSMVADPLALKTILEYPWETVEGELGSRDAASWDWTMVERHIEELSSSAIAPHTETLEKRLREEVEDRAGDLSDEGLRACAALALRHGSPGSTALFRQVWPELDAGAKGSLIDQLLFVETRACLDFLGDVAAGDESEDVRAKAATAQGVLADHLRSVGGR